MDFDLESLGWKAFQDLSLLYAQQRLGVPVTAFSPGPDGGRDGAAVIARRDSGSGGAVTVQAKHSSTRVGLTLAAFKRELPAVRNLAKKGLADTYLLVTNRPLSGGSDAAIRKALRNAGVGDAILVGREELVRQLTEDKVLRGLIPRVYGLGDLSEILDERVYDQTRALVYEDDIKCFVPTQPYLKSLNSLEEHRFALVLGEPASGKSSIMRAAAIHNADRWGLEPLWLDSVAEVARHWNPNRSDQLFLIDDVFGTTNLDTDRVDDWNRAIARMNTAMRTGARFLLTSRDYIYRGARPLLKSHQLPVVYDAEVVINVEELSHSERRQIVYNHLRLGQQPSAFLTAAKPHLWRISASRRFLPEVARRLAEPRFTVGLDPSSPAQLQRFVEEPRDHLLAVIQGLSTRLQAAVLSLVAHGGTLPNPIPESATSAAIAERLGVSPHEIGRAVAELDGSLVRFRSAEGDQSWSIRHPTIIDSMGDWLLSRPDLLDLYCEHAPLTSLRSQVACGANVTGAVALPTELWPTVFGRMLNSPGQIEVGLRFFASRCSPEALRSATQLGDLVPFLDRRPFAAPLDSDPKMRLFLRMAVDDTIPLDTPRLLEEAIETAVEAFDPFPLTNPVVEEVTAGLAGTVGDWPDVVARFKDKVTTNLVAYVNAVVKSESTEVDRPDRVSGLIVLLDVLESWIDDEDEAMPIINEQRTRLVEWAGEDPGPTTVRDMHDVLLRSVFGIPLEHADIFSDLDA